jgi:predicted CoA-substrate-specific enzyme activase
MILGCDIGTSATKAVLFTEGTVRTISRLPTGANPDKVMELVLAELWEKARVRERDLKEIVITGWGQEKVSLPHKTQSMVSALARGAVWSLPSCRTVLCLGAQESVVLSVNEKGRVMEYRTNDKCASGAGRFLEIIFEALEISPEESAEIANRATRSLTMSTQCAVFAESEVVSLVNGGESVANITDAIFQALAMNIASLSKKLKTKDDFVVGGGLANNQRIVGKLRDLIRKPLHVFRPEPDFIAAVGAALSANGVAR